uniref:AAA+ ATPase domain-containing protein n=1 Tax=viral metagenome TaxID=1070528 RepID=A0A6C0C9G6_9ZZZZ
MEKEENGTKKTRVGATLEKFGDVLVNNLVMTKLSGVLDSGFEMTYSNAFKILLLLSVGDIKNGISYAIEMFVWLVKRSPVFALNLIMKISSFMDRRRGLPAQNNLILEDDGLYNKIVMDIELNFMIAMHEYMIKNTDKCRFKTDLTGIKIQNTKENVFTRAYKNIEFDAIDKTDNSVCTIKIETCIIYKFNVDSNEITTVETNSLIEQKPGQIINSYVDLLTSDQQKIVNAIYEHMLKQHGPTIDKVTSFIKVGDIPDTGFSEVNINDLLAEKYPSIDKKKSFVELEIVICLLYKYLRFASITDCKDTISKYEMMLFDIHHSYELKNINKMSGYSYANKLCDHFDNWTNALNISSAEIKSSFSVFIELSNHINKRKTETSSGLYRLPFAVITTKKMEIGEIMKDFITMVYASYRKSTTKVKIFSLTLEEDKKVTEKDNPKYNEWMEKKRMFDSLCTVNKDSKNVDYYAEDSKFEMFKNLTDTIPPKALITEIITKRVAAKKLNDIEKNIDNLYLRDSDKTKLTTALDQFKNKKQTLKDLGFQNKLNLLLYGEPGTGKSTAIQAVATYLQKDIYYVDMQKAQLNEDLQMIFDYVNNNVPNGGIIVIEDIDAMTDIVLKRTSETKEYSVKDLMNNQKSKLTLEYFLNILQGTLTVDNSVFIVTTNYIDHLDDAFYRDGRFDVKIKLKLCDHFQINSIYKKIIGREIPEKILQRIPENKFSPATIIFHIKNYIFKTDASDETILKEFF